MPMRVAKKKIPQIDRQRQRGHDHSDRIALINREIKQRQNAAGRAAFPEAERNHTFSRAFRCDPLNDKTHSENEAAAQAHDLPWVNRDSENVRLGEEELEAGHGRKVAQGSSLRSRPVFERKTRALEARATFR